MVRILTVWFVSKSSNHLRPMTLYAPQRCYRLMVSWPGFPPETRFLCCRLYVSVSNTYESVSQCQSELYRGIGISEHVKRYVHSLLPIHGTNQPVIILHYHPKRDCTFFLSIQISFGIPSVAPCKACLNQRAWSASVFHNPDRKKKKNLKVLQLLCK